MLNPIVSQSSVRRHAAAHRSQRLNHLIGPAALAGTSLAFTSCNEEVAPPAPPPIITDVTPVGDGLSVIGLALIAAAVVLVLGKLLR